MDRLCYFIYLCNEKYCVYLENVNNPFVSFTFGNDIVFEIWSWDDIWSPEFKIKVLEGATWDEISCPLFCLLVVTKSSFELLLDGNVKVGIDEGQDIWRCVEIAFWFDWFKSLTRIWVGWSWVDDDDEVDANDTFEEDAKLWSNDVTFVLFLLTPDKEDVTPEDETRLGDVFNETADPAAEDDVYEVVGFNNEVGIPITDVEISLEVIEEGIILILFIPPVSSIVI